MSRVRVDDAVDCTCFTALLGSVAKNSFISFSSLLRSTFQLRSKIFTFTTCPHDVARRLPPLASGASRLLPSLKHVHDITDFPKPLGHIRGMAGVAAASYGCERNCSTSQIARRNTCGSAWGSHLHRGKRASLSAIRHERAACSPRCAHDRTATASEGEAQVLSPARATVQWSGLRTCADRFVTRSASE